MEERAARVDSSGPGGEFPMPPALAGLNTCYISYVSKPVSRRV